jgi:hypothetical protein
MKYLKKFNEELKHSTYQSAARKLKKIGHVKRADAIEKHSINSNWKKLKDEFQEWGSSKLYFKRSVGDDHSGDFYIALDFMDDPTAESIIDGKEGKNKLHLYFYMNIIPVDNDTIEICNSNLTEPDFNGSYQGPYPSIKYNVVDGELKFDGIHLDFAENIWKLSRRAAMIFKKQLLSCFEQGGNYDSVYERIRETLNREDFSLEFNYDMENIYNDIKNYPINYLYKE